MLDPQPGAAVRLFTLCLSKKEQVGSEPSGGAFAGAGSAARSRSGGQPACVSGSDTALAGFKTLCSVPAARCTAEYQSYLNLQENSCR